VKSVHAIAGANALVEIEPWDGSTELGGKAKATIKEPTRERIPVPAE
jgi:hypothetical protein